MIKAYAAGFMDGEGHIGIYKYISNGYSCCSLQVTISQVCPIPLIALHKEWGGSLTIRKQKNRLSIARLMLSQNQGYKFLIDIRPFLLVKGEEADIAIEFASIPKKQKRQDVRNKKTELCNKLVALRTSNSINRDAIMDEYLHEYIK